MRRALPVLSIFLHYGNDEQQKGTEPDQIELVFFVAGKEREDQAFDAQDGKTKGKIEKENIFRSFPETEKESGRGQGTGKCHSE
jgi:hypothetical protein